MNLSIEKTLENLKTVFGLKSDPAEWRRPLLRRHTMKFIVTKTHSI